MAESEVATSTTTPRSWLTPTVWGVALTSFLSDAGHEAGTAILPLFLAAIGAPPAALGAIEGVADGLSSGAKLIAGWWGDRVPRRKPVVVAGYALTGLSVGLFALATSWPFVLVARAVGWLGRGVRGPLRDAILAEAVPPGARGRAFGFDRTGDTLGAIVGPLLALALLALLGHGAPVVSTYRWLFVLAMVPGILSALTFALTVREEHRTIDNPQGFLAAFGSLPPAFRTYLVGVALFGAGDFAHSLLTLRASQVLAPTLGAARAGQIAVGLYILHNSLYAVASYPIGVLADRFNPRRLLALGYVLMGVMALLLMQSSAALVNLASIFVLGGLAIAAEDTLERTVAAQLLPAALRSTGYGALAAVNGLGDTLSSLVVGFLWTAVTPAAGFAYTMVLSLAGAAIVWWAARDHTRRRRES